VRNAMACLREARGPVGSLIYSPEFTFHQPKLDLF
jgi:hypothetical protein